jgi:hypothetical protein
MVRVARVGERHESPNLVEGEGVMVQSAKYATRETVRTMQIAGAGKEERVLSVGVAHAR